MIICASCTYSQPRFPMARHAELWNDVKLWPGGELMIADKPGSQPRWLV
jgi:hypothetical protein